MALLICSGIDTFSDFSSGAWFQCQAEEGFPECGDALRDATPGCFHHPVVGEGPAREI